MMSEKERFFKKAQELGLIHFIDISQMKKGATPNVLLRITSAIKVLRGLPPTDQEENYKGLDAIKITDAILDLNHQKEALQEEIRVLEVEMSRVDVFGDFSLEDLAYIHKEGNRVVQFYVAKPGAFHDEPLPDNVVWIGSEHGLDYYVAVNSHPVVYDKMIEMKIDHPYGELKKQLKEAQDKLHTVEQQQKKYIKYNQFLHHSLTVKLNEYNLEEAKNDVHAEMDGALFAVAGWVPDNKFSELDPLLKELDIHCEEISIEPTDFVPTYLENKGLPRLGEDLVNIYDTPSSTDKDPSDWVLWAFTLFFALIIGDAGYGLVYLSIALFLRYKYPNLKGTAKRVLNLFTLLCVGCIVWGTLTTSFFGVQVSMDNPIRKFSLIQWLGEKKAEYHLTTKDATYQDWVKKYPWVENINDPKELIKANPDSPNSPSPLFGRISDNILFELALFIGVVHLILSILRYSFRNWNNLGWVVMLIGAYLYFPAHLGAPGFLNTVGKIDLHKGAAIGLQLMAAGLAFAWIGSIVINKFKGLFEVMTVIQILADVLSYLRLYALGLAGAIVGSTVNEIASGLPFLFGVILVVIGHFVNIVLSTMSGVIHGLRLNFLEWYHYSFEGGGKKFRPLKLLGIE